MNINGLSTLGQILGNLGSKLEKVYGTRYGQEEASRDLDQLKDASGNINIAFLQQKLNTGSPFSSSGQAYNQAMEQAGLGVATTNWNVALTKITQDQLSNPNFNPKTATQDFTKLGLQAMNNTLQNVDPSIRTQLQANMVNSLNQNMRFMADKSIKIDTQNQKLSVLDSVDQDNKLVSTYLQRGDAKSALGIVTNQNNKLNLLVNTGAITANEAVAQQKNTTVSALSQIGISQGLSTAKEMNTQLPSNYQLSDDEMKQVSLNTQQDWLRKQQATDISNFQTHANFDLYLHKLAGGDLGATFNGEISDKMSAEIAVKKYEGMQFNEQQNHVNKMERDYRMAGQIANEVGTLTPSDRWNFIYNNPDGLSGRALDLYNTYWKDLPVDAQKVATQAIDAKAKLVQTDTKTALGITSNMTGIQRLSLMQQGNVTPKNYTNGVDDEDIQNYINTTITSPAGLSILNKAMTDKYQVMAPLFFAKVQQKSGTLGNGLKFSQDTPYKDIVINNPIVDPKVLTNKTWITKLDASSKLGLSTVINNQEVIGLINRVDPLNAKQSAQGVIDNIFDNYNGSLVRKGDVQYLTSSDMRTKNNISNLNDIQFRYDALGDAYYGYDNQGKNILSLPRSQLLKYTPNDFKYNMSKVGQFVEDVITNSAEKRIIKGIISNE